MRLKTEKISIIGTNFSFGIGDPSFETLEFISHLAGTYSCDEKL